VLEHCLRLLPLAVAAALLTPAAPLHAEPLVTMQSNGMSSNRIDVVLVGDGYTGAELAKFSSDAVVFAEKLFGESPFEQYRPYFNVHLVPVVSAESGADHPASGIFKDTALGAFYDCSGITRLICVDWTAVNDVLARSVSFEQRDIVIVLVNDPEYGGSGGSIAVSSTHPDGYDVVLHEVGHSFGLLADEYDIGPPACDATAEPIEPNVTMKTNRAEVKWRRWIGPATSVPTSTFNPSEPGLYNGAKYCGTGMYRSTVDSKMRSLYRPFEQVNTEQLVKRMYNVVSPIDRYSPANSLVTTRGVVAFSVVPLAPASHALTVRWELDGVEVSTTHATSVDTRTLANGNHLLRVTVSDPTALVIDDPDQLLRDGRTWTIRVDSVAPTVALTQPAEAATLSGTASLAAAAGDQLGVARVEFWIDGVLAATDRSSPYAFSWNTTAVANGTHTLQARAIDTAGNAAGSAPRIVTVANGATTALPAGWTSVDVGAVGRSGSAVAGADGTFLVQGAGADVWGTADAFHYAYQSLTGDRTIVARVASMTGSQPWTKVGVMIRASTRPDSPHAFMLLSTSKGHAFQRRVVAGGASTHTAGDTGTSPRWMRLQRTGDVFTASVSSDGITWTLVGTETIAMPATVLVGLVAHSHTTVALAAATFDDVTITNTALPDGWTSRDIGVVGLAGSASERGGTFTMKGGGADVWGAADAFHYAYRLRTGNGTIVARVVSIEGPRAWTKMGVMIRASTSPGSRHAFMLVSKEKGLAFQRRVTTGGVSAHTPGPMRTAPAWVKLRRDGNLFTASTSADGLTWTVVGSETITMPATALWGLVAHGHTTTALATVTFDRVAFGP
jgi:regulation of enolase protein 1 (concanavalin A-like superfamily)